MAYSKVRRADLSVRVLSNIVFELVKFNSSRVVGVNHLEERIYELSLDGDLKLGDHVGNFIDSEMAALVKVEIRENFAEQLDVISA